MLQSSTGGSSFVAVLQLCCSPPTLLQSSSFVAVLQLCRSPPALSQSSSFVTVLQLCPHSNAKSTLSVLRNMDAVLQALPGLLAEQDSPSPALPGLLGVGTSPEPGFRAGSQVASPLASRLSPLASRLSPLASPLASPPALRRMVPSARGLAVRGLRNVDPGSGIDCSGGPPRGFRPRSQRPTPHATTASWSRARCRISAVLHELQHLRRSVEPLDPLKLCQAQKNFLTIGVDQQRPQSISSHLSRSAATPVDQQEPQSISSDLSPCVTF